MNDLGVDANSTKTHVAKGRPEATQNMPAVKEMINHYQSEIKGYGLIVMITKVRFGWINISKG